MSLNIKRVLSILLSVSIALTSTYGYGYPTLFGSKPHTKRYLADDSLAQKRTDITADPSSITIPESIGRVIDTYKGKGDSLVIHIQDRHIDPIAQLNIARIIDEFNIKHDTHLMCLEGASRELNTSFYNKFPDGKLKARVAKFFIEKGFFTGAEFYKITNADKYLNAQGAEDKAAYLEHLASYKDNGIDRDKILKFLKAVETSINTLKKKVYSKQLKDINKKASLYYAKQLKLPEYLMVLQGYSKKVEVDITKYKNLNKFIQLIGKEENIDFKKAESQREELIKDLSENLENEKLQELLKNSLDFKLNKLSALEFYAYLEQFLAPNTDNHLTSYIDYLKFSNEIKHLKVFDEAEDFEEKLMLALSKTPIQKNLVSHSKTIKMLQDLYNLRLTRRQLDYLDENSQSSNIVNIQQFLKATFAKYGLNLSPIVASTYIEQQAIDNSKRYYQLALKRDIALVDNTLRAMSRSRRERAMLIAGGFHTQGITNILKEKDISYVVICPSIGTEDCEKLYSDRMAGILPDIGELTESFKHTLSVPLVNGDLCQRETTEYTNKAFKEIWNIAEKKSSSAGKTLPELLPEYADNPGTHKDGAAIDLRGANKQIILIGDLHARVDNFDAILSDLKSRGLMQKIIDREAVLIFLGDAVHSERNLIEMDSSIEMIQKIIQLKITYPDNVYYILGDHDYLSDSIAKGYILQGKLFRKALEKKFGEEISRQYIDLFIKNSGIMLVADGLVATHAGPITYASSFEEAKRTNPRMERHPIVKQAIWHRWGLDYGEEEIEYFRAKITGQPDALFIVAHSPDLIKDKEDFYAELIENHYIIYAARDNWGYAVFDQGELKFIDSKGKETLQSPAKSSSAGFLVGENFWLNILSQNGLQKVSIEHTQRNIRAIKYFAGKEKLNAGEEEILKTALWLHDISKDKPAKDYIPEDKGLSSTFRLLVHHLESAKLAEEILEQLGYDEKFKEQVRDIIVKHMGPVEGSMRFGDKEVGFMELTRLAKLNAIEEALGNSGINISRKKVLIGYIDSLKGGFPQPESKLERIAHDIDLLDLAATGVTKVVYLRQTDSSFFKDGKPETITESFNSALQSARDVGENLYTDTAKEIIDNLVSRLENFGKQKELIATEKEFEKLYNAYIEENPLPYDGVLSGETLPETLKTSPALKASSAGQTVAGAVLHALEKNSKGIYVRVRAEYEKNLKNVSEKFDYLFERTINNLYGEKIDLNDYVVKLERLDRINVGGFKIVYSAELYSKDSDELQYKFVLKTPKTIGEQYGVMDTQRLVREYDGMKEITALFTGKSKNNLVPVLGEIVRIAGVNFLTQEWIDTRGNTYEDLLQKMRNREVDESLISRASQQILAHSIAVWFELRGKFIEDPHSKNFVFYGKSESGEEVGRPMLVDVDELREFKRNEFMKNLRIYLFNIRDLDYIQNDLRDIIGDNEKADKIYEYFDKILFSRFVKANNLLAPKEVLGNRKIIDQAKYGFLCKLLGTDIEYAQDSKVGELVELLYEETKASSAGQAGVTWSYLYSPAQIENLLKNPSIACNEYRLSASINALPEKDIERLEAQYKGRLLEMLPQERYRTWMDLDDFVGALEQFEVKEFRSGQGANYNVRPFDELIESLKESGIKILAHGVNRSGGIEVLLNIMLEGRINSSPDGKSYFAELNYPLKSYGPYYVVMDSAKMKKDNLIPDDGVISCEGDLPADYHNYYIVPAVVNAKEFLIKGLKEAARKGLFVNGRAISEEYVQAVASKLKTYEEFIADYKEPAPVKSSSAGKKRVAITNVSDMVLAVRPELKRHKDRLNYLIMLIGPDAFTKAFTSNSRTIGDLLEIVFKNWDENKFTTLIKQVTQAAFLKAFADNPVAVVGALVTIFANWDKYITFITYVNKDAFSKAFANDSWAIGDTLEIIFANWNEDKLTALVKQITKSTFSKAFADNPAAVAYAIRATFTNWDNYTTFITYLNKDVFSKALADNPMVVAYILKMIFANWSKYTIFITHVNKDDFSKAFTDNNMAVAYALTTIFTNLGKYTIFMAHVNKDDFSKAFADNPAAVDDSLEKIFGNWDEYNKLYTRYGEQLNILRDYASETGQEDITDIFIFVKMLDILRLLKDLPKEADRKLLRELLDKEGLEGLYLILKFFYEFNPLFDDRHKPSFIRNFLGSNFINQEFGFRYGRNYVYISSGENREPLYTITKVFDSVSSAKEEFNGLKLLEKFGKLTKIRLNEESASVNYSTIEPGLFIMPTEAMVYAPKQERMKILTSLLKESLLQIYSLAQKGYTHTSLTSLSHGVRKDNTPNEWIPYRGGEIVNVQEGLKHLNFRPGIGLVDAEHIFYSRELEYLDSSILNKDVAGSVFELLLGLCYGAILQGFSIDEIVSSFVSMEQDLFILTGGSQQKQQVLKAFGKHLREIINNIIGDFIPHQRDTNALLPWLEDNLPGILSITDSENKIIQLELISALSDSVFIKSSSAGKAIERAKELRRSCTELFEDMAKNPYERYFGKSPNISPDRYGLIIYDSTLRGEEKQLIMTLALLKDLRNRPKFEIIVIPSKDGRNLIADWGISGENVKTADSLLENVYKDTGVELQEAFSDEEVLVIETANILKTQMPVGIIAGARVDIEDMAAKINTERRESRDRYVFITSQHPADIELNGEMKRSFLVFEAIFADIINKLRNYEKIAEELEIIPLTERVKMLFEILPAIINPEFIQRIEELKISLEAVKRAA